MDKPINIPLSSCVYNKEKKVLKIDRNNFSGYPRSFFITSNYTGKQVRFVVIGPEDILFDQDQWDGEMQIYRPVSDEKNVDHAIVCPSEWI